MTQYNHGSNQTDERHYCKPHAECQRWSPVNQRITPIAPGISLCAHAYWYSSPTVQRNRLSTSCGWVARRRLVFEATSHHASFSPRRGPAAMSGPADTSDPVSESWFRGPVDEIFRHMPLRLWSCIRLCLICSTIILLSAGPSHRRRRGSCYNPSSTPVVLRTQK